MWTVLESPGLRTCADRDRRPVWLPAAPSRHMIAGVIEQILPDNVAVEDTTEDRLDIELSPAEVQSLGGAVEKRRREFITGRACARGALAQLGMGPVAIPSGERGEPCWPVGIVGSITHCAGYRACALARAGEIAA